MTSVRGTDNIIGTDIFDLSGLMIAVPLLPARDG
jgi:hypothetical protein